MENELLNTQESQTETFENTPVVEDAGFYASEDTQPASEEKAPQSDIKGIDFKFFRNCASSLKKFSILVFIINIFIAVGITGAVTVLLAINLGTHNNIVYYSCNPRKIPFCTCLRLCRNRRKSRKKLKKFVLSLDKCFLQE